LALAINNPSTNLSLQGLFWSPANISVVNPVHDPTNIIHNPFINPITGQRQQTYQPYDLYLANHLDNIRNLNSVRLFLSIMII
jgi:hypothetical protein